MMPAEIRRTEKISMMKSERYLVAQGNLKVHARDGE